MNEDRIIYKQPVKYSPYGYGKTTIIFLDWIPGKRDYPPYIKERDKRIRIGIRQAERCPGCGEIFDSENTCVYSFDDQKAMWRAVFDATVLKGEKQKMIKRLEDLIKEMKKGLGEDNLQGRLL